MSLFLLILCKETKVERRNEVTLQGGPHGSHCVSFMCNLVKFSFHSRGHARAETVASSYNLKMSAEEEEERRAGRLEGSTGNVRGHVA